MPTYQYACTACQEQLEVVQSFADDPLTECPQCAGRLRKVFSPVGVVFKGSGFYRTDSRSSSNGKASSSKNAPGANGSSAAQPDGTSSGTTASTSTGDGAKNTSTTAGTAA